MKPSQKIDIPDWVRDPKTQTVMRAIGGCEDIPISRFVGGCVRNTLLREPVSDIDIATQLMPEQIIQALSNANIKAVPTGIDHGTITAVVDGKPYEITTLRKDVETDGRHAVVAFTDDWAEDANRRDFTLNTLLMDMHSNIYDPTGQGVEDLQARKILFVGDPAARIAEDYLRILRFFRFHAQYGAGPMDQPALKACAAAAHKIETLSKERITTEFLKILSVDNPVDILSIMFENNILKGLLNSSCHPRALQSPGVAEINSGDPQREPLQSGSHSDFVRAEASNEASQRNDNPLETLRTLSELQKEQDAFDLITRLFLMSGFAYKSIQKNTITKPQSHEGYRREETLGVLEPSRLCHDIQSCFDAWLILSNAQKKALQKLNDAYHSLENLEEKSVKILVYRYSNAVALQAILVFVSCHRSDNKKSDVIAKAQKLEDKSNEKTLGALASSRLRSGLSGNQQDNVLKALHLAKNWEAPIFPITGDDLIAQGHKPGPDLGQALKFIEDQWIEDNF